MADHRCPSFTEERGACFSEDRTHRFYLYRKWREGNGVAFLMLNPSIADEMILDPTLRRCKQFAINNGYSMMHIANVFSLVSTDPAGLKGVDINDVHTESNWRHIASLAKNFPVILGFGTNVKKYHYDFVRNRIKNTLVQESTFALRITKDGLPSHPLYLPYTCNPVQYDFTNL